VVLATFLAAFVQGLATTLALQVCGLGHFVIFLALSTVAALIPLAGTWIVWGPCAVWLAAQGHVGSAICLALYGILVVGLLDNVVRTYVLNTDAQLHPLLAFVSVLGALQVMGLWGVFIGPIVASCLYALLQIFNTELSDLATLKRQPHSGT
jgi:predicted PurR-regulated permease PerM